MATENRPLQPKAILRGHKSPVHAAVFFRHNERLVTGDTDGFVVVWDLTLMRPQAVWQAHTDAILGISGWGDDRIITQGRDNRLVVWKLGAQDEAFMSKALPLNMSPEERCQPWMLHMLEINALNFCTFASCAPTAVPSDLLIAVPNTLNSEAIDIFHLPSQRRLYTMRLGEKNGIAMAVSLFYRQDTLTLVVGYESGLAIVAQLGGEETWDLTYRAKVHSQPILSVDVAPNRASFFASGADAIISKHPIPGLSEGRPQLANIVPEPSKGRNEDTEAQAPDPPAAGKSLLSAALAAQPQPTRPSATGIVKAQTEPLKVVNTKHSGQQSLKIRSDARIFATAGWDSKIRVYSAKTMKEVAVLKWHQVGCYAVAFSVVEHSGDGLLPGEARHTGRRGPQPGEQMIEGETSTDTAITTVLRSVEMSARDKRITHARTAHWLAAGSKDGKVSLWDVF